MDVRSCEDPSRCYVVRPVLRVLLGDRDGVVSLLQPDVRRDELETRLRPVRLEADRLLVVSKRLPDQEPAAALEQIAVRVVEAGVSGIGSERVFVEALCLLEVRGVASRLVACEQLLLLHPIVGCPT